MSDALAYWRPKLAPGYSIHPVRNGHYAIKDKAGRHVAQVAATPGDHRTRINELTKLIRLGAVLDTRPHRRAPEERTKKRQVGLVHHRNENTAELAAWGEARSIGVILEDTDDRRIRTGYKRVA